MEDTDLRTVVGTKRVRQHAYRGAGPMRSLTADISADRCGSAVALRARGMRASWTKAGSQRWQPLIRNLNHFISLCEQGWYMGRHVLGRRPHLRPPVAPAWTSPQYYRSGNLSKDNSLVV